MTTKIYNANFVQHQIIRTSCTSAPAEVTRIKPRENLTGKKIYERKFPDLRYIILCCGRTDYPASLAETVRPMNACASWSTSVASLSLSSPSMSLARGREEPHGAESQEGAATTTTTEEEEEEDRTFRALKSQVWHRIIGYWTANYMYM